MAEGPESTFGRPRLRNDHRQDPELKIPLQERIKTPEMQTQYESLQADVEHIRSRLFRDVKFMDERMREPLPERVVGLLLHLARDAQLFSDHYGNYRVGGVLVGLRKPTTEDPNPWVVRFNANTRPSQEVRKYCAEQYLLDDAESMHARGELDNVVAVLVAARPRQMQYDPVGLMDDVSQKKQITLTCCELCRSRLWDMSTVQNGIVSQRSTEVITARSDVTNLGLRKSFKVVDLMQFHGDRLPEGFESIDGND